MMDRESFQRAGLIDLGRLGTAGRYADLALTVANARESWGSPEKEARAFAIPLHALGIGAPGRERLVFYLPLDPLTWGWTRRATERRRGSFLPGGTACRERGHDPKHPR